MQVSMSYIYALKSIFIPEKHKDIVGYDNIIDKRKNFRICMQDTHTGTYFPQ
jgi:hypothetical protein